MIEVGCGPGRMVRSLDHARRAVLGVDISSVAVEAGSRGGGQVLRRHLTDSPPGEGRWPTVLPLDGEVGIGGDVRAVVPLPEPGRPWRSNHLRGRPGPHRNEAYEVMLSDSRHRSAPMPWASIGGRASPPRKSGAPTAGSSSRSVPNRELGRHPCRGTAVRYGTPSHTISQTSNTTSDPDASVRGRTSPSTAQTRSFSQR